MNYSEIREEKPDCTNDILPYKKRNDFQIFLMQGMGVKPHDNKAEIEWINTYAKKVSDIIDDVSSEDDRIIRSLIMDDNYNEASKYVREKLKKLEQKEVVYH